MKRGKEKERGMLDKAKSGWLKKRGKERKGERGRVQSQINIKKKK